MTEKERYDAALRDNALLRRQLAAAGVVVPSGGIDFDTGERVSGLKIGPFTFGGQPDYGKMYGNVIADTTSMSQAAIQAQQEKNQQAQEESKKFFQDLLEQSSTGNIQDVVDATIDYRYRTQDLDRQEQDEAMNRSILQSQRQLATVMPYLDEAGRRATERNLNASQRFLDFKERMPTAVQNRMLSSSTAFAQNLQAVATAANAAANMAQSGTNRSFGR
jgi:lantibiotic modifying enzyme|tara:strand:- start:1319 stop:1975 length:657 start_codon:yes stop_codon:yes gene_type:complete